MKKKVLLTVFLLLLIANVSANPSATVVYPNGSETLWGDQTLLWDVNSSDFSQDLNVQAYFSLTAGGQDANGLVLDDNLFDYCSFSSIGYWSRDTNFEGGLDARMFGHGNSNQGQTAIYVNDTGQVNIIFKSFDSPYPIEYHGATWNAVTTNWDSNDSILTGLFLPGGRNWGGFESFTYNGSTYLMQVDTATDGGAGLPWKNYSYVLTDNTWVQVNDFSSGLSDNEVSYKFTVVDYDINGGSLWLVDYNDNSWYYNGSSWIDNDYLGDSISSLIPQSGGIITDAIEIKPFNDDLYLFYPIRDKYVVNAFKWNASVSPPTWENSNDLNASDTIGTRVHGVEFFDYLEKTYMLIHDFESGTLDDAEIFEYKPHARDTKTTFSCSFSVDTTTITNGNYFLDVNVIDNENASDGLDSSDSSFTIENGDCTNGVKDGPEQGIDCGGVCEPCDEKHGNCVPIIQNGDEDDKIDVVFVGSGFPDLDTFDDVVEEMIDYNGTYYGLMSVEPFKSRKDEFNFWKVNKLSTFPAFDFGASAKVSSATNCPFRDQTIYLSVTPRFRSNTSTGLLTTAFGGPLLYYGVGIAQANVFIGEEYLEDCDYGDPDCDYPWPLDIPESILNPFDPNCQGDGNMNVGCDAMGYARPDVIRTVLHEFGHSFGGLADEYDLEYWLDNSFSDPSEHLANCDVATCPKWSDINSASCFTPCGYDNWYRAYNNTIMTHQFPENFWGDDYNEVNERELERRIDNFSALNPSVSGFSYVMDLNYYDGNIFLIDVNLVKGKANNFIDTNGDYKMNISTSTGYELYDLNFNFPLKRYYSASPDWWDENGTQIDGNNTVEDVNNVTVSLTLPFNNEADAINLYDENYTLLLSADVSDLKPVNFSIGHGGRKTVGLDYNVTYSLTSQPTKKLIGSDYNVLLGWLYSIIDN
jgi:hypothetical protein